MSVLASPPLRSARTDPAQVPRARPATHTPTQRILGASALALDDPLVARTLLAVTAAVSSYSTFSTRMVQTQRLSEGRGR
jgi:hypothetical protein